MNIKDEMFTGFYLREAIEELFSSDVGKRKNV